MIEATLIREFIMSLYNKNEKIIRKIIVKTITPFNLKSVDTDQHHCSTKIIFFLFFRYLRGRSEIREQRIMQQKQSFYAHVKMRYVI